MDSTEIKQGGTYVIVEPHPRYTAPGRADSLRNEYNAAVGKVVTVTGSLADVDGDWVAQFLYGDNTWTYVQAAMLRPVFGEDAAASERLQQARQELVEARLRHQQDIDNLSAHLLRLRDEQGWCEDGFNREVDEANEYLLYPLQRASTEYDVRIRYTEKRSTTITLTVTASSEDEARSKVDDMEEKIELAVSSAYDWDNDGDDDWEVEGVESV